MRPLIFLNKFFKKLFFSYLILEECESPINGKIKIVETLSNKRRLMVGGLTQSGDLVEEIWEKALNKIQDIKYKISDKNISSNILYPLSNILILGLGAGTVANLINKSLPNSYIIGVEIDEVIVGLGKKYFDLDKIKNLKIIITDAVKFVSSTERATPNTFDLILVDLYLGDKFPKEFETKEFLENLKKIISKNGMIIFNRLNYQEKKLKNDEFKSNLQRVFNNVEDFSYRSNCFFYCFNR